MYYDNCDHATTNHFSIVFQSILGKTEHHSNNSLGKECVAILSVVLNKASSELSKLKTIDQFANMWLNQSALQVHKTI